MTGWHEHDTAADHRVLSAPEEARLGRLIRAGASPDATDAHREAGRGAEDMLARHNVRLAYRFAADFARRNPGYPFDEAFGNAMLGIALAVRKFDPDRARFGSVAAWWMRGYALRGMQAACSAIPVPGRVAGKPEGRAVASVGRLGDFDDNGEGIPDGREDDESIAERDRRRDAVAGKVRAALIQLGSHERAVIERRYEFGGRRKIKGREFRDGVSADRVEAEALGKLRVILSGQEV